MGIIFYVASRAILACRFEVGNRPGAGMAAPTIHRGMFSGQLKSNVVMVEGVAVAVNSIMTGQAILSIRQEMGLHENGFNLPVARFADGLIKPGIAIGVTCIAHKRRTIRLALVSG